MSRTPTTRLRHKTPEQSGKSANKGETQDWTHTCDRLIISSEQGPLQNEEKYETWGQFPRKEPPQQNQKAGDSRERR